MNMSFYSGSLLITSIASLSLGVFVYLKGRRKPQNITLGLCSAGMTLWCFGQFLGEIFGAKEAVLFSTRLGIAGAIMLPIFFLHFVLALVEREREDKWILALAYASGAFFLAMDLTPLFVADVVPAPGFRYYPRPGIVYPFFALFLLACFCRGFFVLFRSYRGASGQRRNQLLYVTIASLIGFLGGITAFFPVWGIGFPVISHVALPLYLLITVYAIVKHRLLEISMILREGLVYSTLTLLFAGFYALAVISANYFFSSLESFHPAAAVLMVVFVSVLVFQPLRDRVQKGVDRVFYRGEFRYQKTIDDLSTENQRLFRTLLRADKLAALGTLSAGMAHEIKNPLASIKGMTQSIEDNLDDPAFINKYQEIVSRQIDRINSLVEKLLKFGQPGELCISAVSLKRAVEETLLLLESQFKKKGIEVVSRIREPLVIEGDFEHLSQVFMNLFLNAAQAMPGGGRLTVSASALSPEHVCLEVRDTGTGISPEKIDRIFDPFFSSKAGGSGMGLAVVYRIVKEHNGEINVESPPAGRAGEEGKGTEFRIWLPIKQKRSA